MTSKLIITCMLLWITAATQAQEAPHGPSQDDLAKANNPMAKTKAFNIHNYMISSLYGKEGVTVNQLIARYAQPAGPLLIRASMPFIVSASPSEAPVTGLGDFNLFAIYSIPSGQGKQFGIGPNVTVPTGTRELGTGKWQVGISALAFFSKSRVVQIGSLLQWSTSVGGDEDRPDVSLLTPQVFFIWQLGGGTYARSSGAWSFDLENGHYNIPIGLGLGKVVKAGRTVFNLFAEPQLSVLSYGAGQPRFQTFIGFNTQF